MMFTQMMVGFLIQTVPYAALCQVPFQDRLRLGGRRTLAVTLALLLGLSLLFAALTSSLKNDGDFSITDLNELVNLLFLICLVPCCLWLMIDVQAYWAEKLFVFNFLITVAMAVTSVGNVWVGDVPEGWDGLPYTGNTIPILALLTSIAIPSLGWLFKRAYVPAAKELSPKEFRYLAGLTLILLLLLGSVLVFFDYNHLAGTITLAFYIALMTCALLVDYVLIGFLKLSGAQAHLRLQCNQAKNQLKIQAEQYKRIRGEMDEYYRFQHDLHHHMIVLQEHLTAGEYESAMAYMHAYTDSAVGDGGQHYCDYGLINALLNHYGALAKAQAVRLDVRIALSAAPVIDDTDLSVLLGNLLENAMQGACDADVEKRWISLNMIDRGSMLVLTLDNSFNGRIRMSGQHYQSTKKNHPGLGIQSVLCIAERYGGVATFTHDGSVFHSSVMLNQARGF